MKKMFNMKRLALIAVVFMMVFVAFSSIDFIDSAKAAADTPVDDGGDGGGGDGGGGDGGGGDGDPCEGRYCSLYCEFGAVPGSCGCECNPPPGNPPDLEECVYRFIDGEWVYQCPDDDGYDEYFIDDDDDTGNSPPVADDDSATVNEDSALNQINARDNDYDPDGDTITISSVGSASHGITSTDGIYAFYTPNADYFGSDQFTYTIFDGNGGSDAATVQVTVQNVPDPPPQPTVDVTPNSPDTNDDLTCSITNQPPDKDGDTITHTYQWYENGIIIPGETNTILQSIETSNGNTYECRVTPNDGTEDGQYGSDSATIANSCPEANDDSATVNEGETVKIDVSDNDEDLDDGLDLSSIDIKNPPSYGSFSVNSDGTVDYIHDGSEISSDSFTYTIKDNSGQESNEAPVSVSVNLVTEESGKPSIVGDIMSCYTVIPYTFKSELIDAGINAKYYFYWDDGEEIPDPALWTPLPSSDRPLTLEVTQWWSNAGVYDVKVGVIDPDSSNPEAVWSPPLPVQVIHKSENPEDG